MGEKRVLQICMGSACHQLGVYQVLPVLQKLIAEFHVDDQIELKGAFCLGVCSRGVVLKLEDDLIIDVTAKNIRKKFVDEVLTRLEGETGA